MVWRRVADSDSGSEPDEPVPERYHRGEEAGEVVVEEEDEEEGESGDDSAIVSDGDVEYDSASDNSLDVLDQRADAMERPHRGRRRRREERDSSDDEDQPRRRRRRRSPTPEYENWEVMRGQYEDSDNDCEEPDGYCDWPQLHAEGWRPDDDSDAEWEESRQDALWTAIKDKLGDPAVRDRLGMRAVEKLNEGRVERVVERFKYGTDFAKFEDTEEGRGRHTGNYKEAFFPVMKELFVQEPYQAPPDPGPPRILPEPRFLDFRHAFHSHKPVGDDYETQLQEHPDGPLWCLCCQCTAKSLQKIMIARHKQSRILVVTGGDCANKMLGQNAYDQARADDKAVRDLVL